jgi:hypothetical protein
MLAVVMPLGWVWSDTRSEQWLIMGMVLTPWIGLLLLWVLSVYRRLPLRRRRLNRTLVLYWRWLAQRALDNLFGHTVVSIGRM